MFLSSLPFFIYILSVDFSFPIISILTSLFLCLISLLCPCFLSRFYSPNSFSLFSILTSPLLTAIASNLSPLSILLYFDFFLPLLSCSLQFHFSPFSFIFWSVPFPSHLSLYFLFSSLLRLLLTYALSPLLLLLSYSATSSFFISSLHYYLHSLFFYSIYTSLDICLSSSHFLNLFLSSLFHHLSYPIQSDPV